MMSRPTDEPRVLAVDPTSRGFGYAVLEGSTDLIDWGVTEGPKADNAWVVVHVTELIGRYSPDWLIREDTKAGGARRRTRVQELLVQLSLHARRDGTHVARISRNQVKRMFRSAEATNKEQIADAIVGHFEELRISRPPVRKTWMNEDPRMAIFDAVAFALAYFYFDDEKTLAA